MKRTQKGDKNARSVRFAQSHRRVASPNSVKEGWDKELEKTIKAEWAEKHSQDDNSSKQDAPKKYSGKKK